MKFIRTCTVNNETGKVTKIEKRVVDELWAIRSAPAWLYTDNNSLLVVTGYDLNSVDGEFLYEVSKRQGHIKSLKELENE